MIRSYALLAAVLAGSIVSTTLYFRAERQRDLAERRGYVANLAAAESSIELNEIREAKRQLELCPPRLRGWEWAHLSFRADSSLAAMGPHEDVVRRVRFSADGRRIF